MVEPAPPSLAEGELAKLAPPDSQVRVPTKQAWEGEHVEPTPPHATGEELVELVLGQRALTSMLWV